MNRANTFEESKTQLGDEAYSIFIEALQSVTEDQAVNIMHNLGSDQAELGRLIEKYTQDHMSEVCVGLEAA